MSGRDDTEPATTAEASEDDSDFLALLQDVARPKGDDEHVPLPARGEVLEGDFEVLSALGSGGMADVFLARDLRLGRHVAVKIARLPSGRMAHRMKLSMREQVATARLSHPNIVAIYGVGAWKERPFMVLELVRGEPLARVMRAAPMDLPQVLDVGSQVLAGLAHAHGRGIVHTDIKPANIMLADDGTVKILDFGLAGMDTERTTLASALGDERDRDSPRGGTPGYMAPEQWRGEVADERTDVWLTGMLLFEAVAGKLPFADRDACLSDAPTPRLDQVVPETSKALADAVARALAKRPEDRFAAAAEMTVALAAVAHPEPEDADSASPYWTLRPFAEADAGWFFGRRREVADLSRRCAHTPLVVVVGPSGAGKSSLVHAGLVPAMRRESPTLSVLRLRPGRHPMDVLQRRLLEHAAEEAADLAPLVDEPGGFGRVLRQRARATGRRFVVVADQLEELWTQADPAERRPFLQALAGAGDDAESPIRVVATIRDDFLVSLAAVRELHDQFTKGIFVLGRPDSASLREALVEPARRLGYGFEEGLVETVLEGLHAAISAPLPFLQAAASRLWERRDEERRLLTRDALDALDGVAGLLAQHADEVLARLPTPIERRVARSILTMLVTETSAGYASRPVPTGRVLVRCGDEERAAGVLVALIEGGLLSRAPADEFDPDAGTTVTLAHEALLQAWGTLAEWLREDPERRRVREDLADAAFRWDGAQRGGTYLLGAVELSRTTAFLGSGADLHPTELAFVEASRELLRRGRRRRNVVLGLVIGVLAAALGLGVSALVAAERSDTVPAVKATSENPGDQDQGLLMVGPDYELHVRQGQVWKVPLSRPVRSWSELRELYRYEDGSPLPEDKPATLDLPPLRVDDPECVRRGVPCVLVPR